MNREILDSLVSASEQDSHVLVTALDSGQQWFLRADPAGSIAADVHDLPESLLPALERAIGEDRSVIEDVAGVRYFLRPFLPPVRLILVGAVHVTQSLAPMAGLAGLSVVVVDPRSTWLTEFRMPDALRMRAWPDAALEELAPDHRTAIVTLTHDPKVDDPALIAALRSPAFYVGALGSRRTHAKRLERLRESGCTAAELDRIHSPVGLDIGARTPSEIAVSVLAELVGALRKPS